MGEREEGGGETKERAGQMEGEGCSSKYCGEKWDEESAGGKRRKELDFN